MVASPLPQRDVPTGTTLTERVVLMFLLAAVAVLLYVYVGILPGQDPLVPQPFDLQNPMLEAEVGECVVIESTTNPGDLVCLKVCPPGIVLRPRWGPSKLGIYRHLERQRPYLACALRYPPPGKDCSDAGTGRHEIELFGLDAFGMPCGVDVALDAIRPMWVEHGGRHLFVYEVQLAQYGPAARTWFVYLHPGAPVTGTVLRRHTADRHRVHDTFFTPAENCR